MCISTFLVVVQWTVLQATTSLYTFRSLVFLDNTNLSELYRNSTRRSFNNIYLFLLREVVSLVYKKGRDVLSSEA